MHMRKPIIGIPADRRLLNSHWFHCVGEKYINAVVQAADAVLLDTTYLTQEEQVERIVALARAVTHRPHVT